MTNKRSYHRNFSAIFIAPGAKKEDEHNVLSINLSSLNLWNSKNLKLIFDAHTGMFSISEA